MSVNLLCVFICNQVIPQRGDLSKKHRDFCAYGRFFSSSECIPCKNSLRSKSSSSAFPSSAFDADVRWLLRLSSLRSSSYSYLASVIDNTGQNNWTYTSFILNFQITFYINLISICFSISIKITILLLGIRVCRTD